MKKAVRWEPLVKADLRDVAAILDAIKTYGIKSAIHFAAFSQVGESVADPAKYFDNNVGAAMAFAKSLVKGGVKAIVFSSTAVVYGAPQTPLISETYPAQPINPYGTSKLAFENVLHEMRQTHGLEHTVLRYFNAAAADLDGEAGESHAPETHLIPLICRAAQGTRQPLTIFGKDYATKDGTAIRAYIHVADLASAHIAAVRRLLAGGASDVFNVGTGEGVSVLDMLSSAARILKRPIPHNFGPRRPGDPAVLVADTRKIRSALD
jgi:UDP-glucose 4-epimerase/UDP-arabinose 4-epimerase